jgi:hypothetical protein
MWKRAMCVVLGSLVLAVAVPWVLAGGWSSAHGLAAGAVAVTNAQVNSAWVPVAVLVRYVEPATATVTVSRISTGLTAMLGECVFTNALSVVWVPETDYWFALGDVLVIESSVTNGTAQLIRKGG